MAYSIAHSGPGRPRRGVGCGRGLAGACGSISGSRSTSGHACHTDTLANRVANGTRAQDHSSRPMRHSTSTVSRAPQGIIPNHCTEHASHATPRQSRRITMHQASALITAHAHLGIPHSTSIMPVTQCHITRLATTAPYAPRHARPTPHSRPTPLSLHHAMLASIPRHARSSLSTSHQNSDEVLRP